MLNPISIAPEDSLTEFANDRRLPPPLTALDALSRNYWWSWQAEGNAIFRALDPALWEACEQNVLKFMRRVADLRLLQMATDPDYCARLEIFNAGFESYLADNGAAQSWGAITTDKPVAYFCAEYGVHHSLPLYSGGLGILAGDHLKSASDLGLPLVAVGLMYRFGYFRQRLTRDGWQDENYIATNPDELSLTAVTDESGAPVIVTVEMRGRKVHARAWLANIGRVNLYLLDTNIDENDEIDRWVTGHLYGGDRETRIVQEIMLGIGGVRLLRKLNVTPHVYHLNEGHSAFLTLELARELIAAEDLNFAEARERVRSKCVFTTHTPVAAGNDEFLSELVLKCFGQEFFDGLKLTREELLQLGRVTPEIEEQLFGLTPLALRMCRNTNGVSQKHGEVSRVLWCEMFPQLAHPDEVPINSITNGVHAPTWIAPNLQVLLQKYVGDNWREALEDADGWRESVMQIPAGDIWREHSLLKAKLIAYMRGRTVAKRRLDADDREYIEEARTLFRPDALTIGFARRVAAYKRWNLILSDVERLLKLLQNEERPVQFVFAGKAHPQDQGAKQILQNLALWKREAAARRHIVFVEDYDQEIARHLVQGVDVWLNVPRRPLEASGTSGQKVAMNGGLNFSILDGWWIEGYDGTNGWAIGDVQVATADEMDAADAESLYRTLEEEIVPTYYERDENNLPLGWIEMMKRAIATLTPAFSSNRMVKDYARKIYP